MRSGDDIGMTADEGGGFGVRDILAAVRRRLWLIAGLALVAGAIAAAIALAMPNRYTAVASIQIDPRKKTIVSLDQVLPDIAGDTPTIESQVEIIRSRVIALRVIEALGLREDGEFTDVPPLRRLLRLLSPDSWRSPAKAVQPGSDDQRLREVEEAARGVAGPRGEAIGADDPERDDVAAAFADRLRTIRVRNTLVVEILFQARDPVKAARIANAVAEVYIRDQIEMKVKATGLAAELLEKKIEGLRQKVAEAEHRVVQFKADNRIFDAEGQLLSEKQLSRLMEQTIMARNATAEARARFEQLQHMLRDGEGKNVDEVLKSHTVRMLKEQLGRATRREAELITRYGSKHPELIKARAELADISGQLALEIDQIVANVKNEYKVAADRERMLEQSLNQLKDQQNLSKEVSVKLRDLEREAETSRRVLEAFLARYKQTTESQDLHLPDARIVEKADVPTAPTAPKRKQIVLIGAFGGLGLGLGLALLLELMTPGLARPEDADTTLGVPHLATVPMLKRSSDGLSDPNAAVRVVLTQPHGVFARKLRLLESEIDRRRGDPTPRVLLVASSLPNEGKTVIAANLALALAARGTRTLIIDADLRRSTLSQKLGVEEAPGLIDAVGYGQDFESVILRDTVSGLAVMPAGGTGRVVLSPPEVLEAPGFGQRIARLKAHFDTIIIDVPPLLPVVDGRIVADYADQIVFVAAWQRTPKQLVRRAVSLLGANAAKIIGLVINQADPVVHARNPLSRGGVRQAAARRAA